MNMKTCTKCHNELPIDMFHNCKASPDGKKSRCKECRISDSKSYANKNKEAVKEYQRKYREENSARLAKYRKEWGEKNKEKYQQVKRKYYQDNKCKIADRQREYVEENRDKVREYHRNYMREYVKDRSDRDPQYKLIKLMRSRLYKALKRCQKSATTMELVGCSSFELKSHIESLFLDGMSWENYGEWHVDHIKPCSSFDFMDPSQQYECFNYKNLQPLWANDNLRKSDKLANNWLK